MDDLKNMVKTTDEDGSDAVRPIVIGNSHGLLGKVLSNAVLAHAANIAKKDVPVVLIDPKSIGQEASSMMENEFMKGRLDDLLILNCLPEKKR